jgi:hypothetical protein
MVIFAFFIAFHNTLKIQPLSHFINKVFSNVMRSTSVEGSPVA